MKTSPSLRSTMRDAAGKATQGDWQWDAEFPRDLVVGNICNHVLSIRGDVDAVDRAHIALSCPSNVAALLDDVETLRALLREALWLIDELTEDTPDRAHAVRAKDIAKEGDL